MQFQIPQFIETESKIIGPLSLKQFAYMGIAGFMVFILFYILETFIWIFFSVIIVGMAFALAFIRFNGQKLPLVIVAIARYLWRPKFFLWQAAQDEIQAESGISRQEEKMLQKKSATAPGAAPIAPIAHQLKNPEPSMPAPPTPKSELAPPISETGPENYPVVAARAPTGEMTETKPAPPTRLDLASIETELAPAASNPTAPAPIQQSPQKPPGQNLKNLWLKLSTATKTIAHREKRPPQAAAQNAQSPGTKSEEIFELFRKITGEREVARRVDYR